MPLLILLIVVLNRVECALLLEKLKGEGRMLLAWISYRLLQLPESVVSECVCEQRYKSWSIGSSGLKGRRVGMRNTDVLSLYSSPSQILITWLNSGHLISTDFMKLTLEMTDGWRTQCSVNININTSVTVNSCFDDFDVAKENANVCQGVQLDRRTYLQWKWTYLYGKYLK